MKTIPETSLPVKRLTFGDWLDHLKRLDDHRRLASLADNKAFADFYEYSQNQFVEATTFFRAVNQRLRADMKRVMEQW